MGSLWSSASAAAPPRDLAPYLFHGQTTSLCETCLKLVPAKILIEGDNVFYLKRCARHGVQKTKISSDAGYWKSAKDYLKPGDRPLMTQSETLRGCPHDCGLCPDHEQHSCLALLEITEHCNLACPTCFAGSSPQRQGFRSLDVIADMLDTLVASEGEPDLVQISGGEPTLHPQFFEILDACRARPIRHLMINTNGIRIAREPAFAARLAEYMPGFEVYLQFDSLKRDALIALRGADLRSIRQQALEALDRHNVSTTLVVTARRGVNDHEIEAIVQHALQWRCVRGVTFQPVQDAGRNPDFGKDDRLLLSDIRRAVARSGVFSLEDMIPLPCNPEAISIGYGLRDGTRVVPVTSLIPREALVASAPNTVAFEAYPQLQARVFDLLSLSTAAGNTDEKLAALLCCLPEATVPQNLCYAQTFRVVIVSFMDRFNFDLGGVKRSCIHFVEPDGKIYPFDTFNLFYRKGARDQP